jgi:hypothetical protein
VEGIFTTEGGGAVRGNTLVIQNAAVGKKWYKMAVCHFEFRDKEDY